MGELHTRESGPVSSRNPPAGRRRDDNIYTAGNIGKEWKKYKSLRGREASVEVRG
jgi:hypothetical protein